MKININKKIISSSVVFLTLFSLSFCVFGEKAFAVKNPDTYPTVRCVDFLNPDNIVSLNAVNRADTIKIVFDIDYEQDIGKLKKYIELAINSMKSTDPFKKYFNRFSFYYSENDNYICNGINDNITINLLFSQGRSSAIHRYNTINIYMFEPKIGIFDFKKRKIIDDDFMATFVHELAHIVGNLEDEYNDLSITNLSSFKNNNCSIEGNTGSDYRSSLTGLLYGSTDIRGCYYRDDSKFFRPSEISLMRFASIFYDMSALDENSINEIELMIKDSKILEYTRFNVISCGYLIAGIKGEAPIKSNAEKYWPECCALRTADGYNIPGCFPQRKTIFFPPEKRCEETTFTNILDKTPYDTDMKISSSNDISLLTIDDDNFFKINGKDVSVPDDNGGRKIPAGDLAVIPANTEIKIETGDKTCREYDITLSLEEEYFNLGSPFSCFISCK